MPCAARPVHRAMTGTLTTPIWALPGLISSCNPNNTHVYPWRWKPPLSLPTPTSPKRKREREKKSPVTMVWSKVHDTEIAALEDGNDDCWEVCFLWSLFRVGGHGKLDRSRLGGIPVGFSGGLANDSNIKILQQYMEKTYHVSTLKKKKNNKNCDCVVLILPDFPDSFLSFSFEHSSQKMKVDFLPPPFAVFCQIESKCTDITAGYIVPCSSTISTPCHHPPHQNLVC